MKRCGFLWGVLFFFFTVLLAGCSIESAPEEKVIADSFNSVKVVGKRSAISADGVLHVDSKGAKDFLRAAQTAAGLFEPGKSYLIKFKCRIDSAEDGAFFLFTARSDSLGPLRDLGTTTVARARDFQDVEMQISIPEGVNDYSLKFSTKGSLSGVLKDLKITQGTGLDFYPFAESQREYCGEIGKTATGCPDFNVELPAGNPNAPVVNAADFGATENNLKFCDAMNAAVAHCRKVGARKLVLPKGVYHLYNSGPITFEGLKDFEFDGGGSTFIFLRDKGLAKMKGLDASKISNNFQDGACVKIFECERVKVGNFNIDWDWAADPLGSIVRVENVCASPGGEYIDYKFVDYDNFPRRDLRVANLSSYDPVSNLIGVEGGATLGYEFYKGKNIPKMEWLSGNVLRVWHSHYSRRAKVGDFYRMQHYYYDGAGVLTHQNRHLTLSKVNVYSCRGHAFVVSGTQQYWQYLDCSIKPPEGAKARAITCTADHLHVVNSRGYMKLIGCDFMLGADDCINVHDCTGYAVRKSDFSLETRNVRGIKMFKVGDPIELRDDDFSPSGFTGKIKSVKPIDASKGVHEIVFADKIPQPKGEGFIMFNRYYSSGNILLRNCKFHSNRARGIIIQCPNVTVENCVIKNNEMAGMRIVTGYTPNLWSEGFGVDNLLVRGCVFESTNRTDVKADGFARDIHIGIYRTTGERTGQTMYPIMSNITFEKNTFKNAYGLVAFITSSGNVVFRENIIINDIPRKKPLPYRGSFLVKASTDTAIVNNIIVESKYAPNPGVYAEADTVKGLKIGGNKIVSKFPER
ncbi:alpha-galactosidase [Coraliomargarita sp. CAG:312]|nr:alpha-galactosidase [Coraliomargarita sp. CAG:312]